MNTEVIAALSRVECVLPEPGDGTEADLVAGIPCMSFPIRQPWATQAKVMDVPTPDALAAATRWLGKRAPEWTVTIRAEHAHEAVFAGLTPSLELPCLTLEAAAEPVPAVDGLTIGPARDADEILTLYGSEFARLITPEALVHKGVDYLIGRIGGQPVACGKAEIAAGTAYISGITVAPAYRGRGIGTAISAAVIEAAKRRNPSLIWLTAVRELHPLYTRLGFRVADVHVQLRGTTP
jgi:GNAT superfamily N-acetyltransferase